MWNIKAAVNTPRWLVNNKAHTPSGLKQKQANVLPRAYSHSLTTSLPAVPPLNQPLMSLTTFKVKFSKQEIKHEKHSIGTIWNHPLVKATSS